jgi:hypothetical protein
VRQDFLNALVSEGPHPTLGPHADTYGRLIGSWRGELHSHLPGLTIRPSSLEIHFAWAYEGRAIVDLWISPAREERAKGIKAAAPPLDWYGATVRFFDAKAEVWRATWWNAIGDGRIELHGVRQGDDIVQVGQRQGRAIRWTFTDIGPRSFAWQGHVLEPDGKTWREEVAVHARRQTP